MSRSTNPGIGLTNSSKGQRAYVWIVATSTLLLIGLFVWPLSVKQFRTTSVFQLRYEPHSGLEKASLNRLVVESLREQTDRSALADVVSRMETTMSSSVLNSLDPDLIRQSMNIQGRPGASANSIEYRLSMTGDGSPDEVEFLNAVVSRINSHLAVSLTQKNHAEVVEHLTNDLGEFYDSRLNQLSGQVSEVLASLSTVNNDIKIVTGDLRRAMSGTEPLPNSSEPFGRPAESELQRLKNQKEQLLSQPGMTQFHPQVAPIQRKIESLANGQASSRNDQHFLVSTDRKTHIVQNQFSAARETGTGQGTDPVFTASIERIVGDIKLIDLMSPQKALSGIQQSLEDTEGADVMIARLNERAIEQLQYTSPVELASFELAERSSPVGGAPTLGQFIWLFLIAGIFGTVAATNFDPSMKKRPFRSVEQLQRRLSLPVVGVLRSRSTADSPKPFNKLAAARVLQFCEWTLLALAVLLILAALVNSQVAAAFIENPFHGITKTIWLMSSGH